MISVTTWIYSYCYHLYFTDKNMKVQITSSEVVQIRGNRSLVAGSV
jgi:hypothetical protein